MRFSDVIGQQDSKARLLEMVSEDRVPHALMLYGPSGAGKMALAMAFASYLLCNHKEQGDSCGKCRQCLMLEQWQHPDLHFSFPVIRPAGTSAEHKMSSSDFFRQWRHLIQQGPYFTLQQWLMEMGAENQQAVMGVGESSELIHDLNIKSSQGGYKVSIVWLPERMNAECANKLLKLLEEPPHYTVFILVSEEPEKLLDTIRSRVQALRVKPLSTQDIEQALIDKRGIEPDAALRIARAANGSWLAALDELDASSEKRLFLDMFIMLMRLAYMRNIRELKKWSETIAGYGREKQKRLLTYFLRLVRENFMYNFDNASLCYMTQEEENFARNFARFINEANVLEISDIFNCAIRDIGQNANPKIVFFDLATHIIVALIRKP